MFNFCLRNLAIIQNFMCFTTDQRGSSAEIIAQTAKHGFRAESLIGSKPGNEKDKTTIISIFFLYKH